MVLKMRLSTDRRCLGSIAAVLGILQGSAWTIMSLTAIVLHNWSPDIDTPTDYRELVEYVIFHRFIKATGDSTQAVSFIFRPEDFTILMWIYFLLSVGWVALSIDLFAAIHRNKKRQTSMMITWGTVTLIVSLIDLIFTCLLGRDYSVCGEVTESETVTDFYSCYLAVGIILTVAARGFTLWVVNLVFAISLIYVAANVIKENTGFGSLYSVRSIPRVKIPKSDTSGSLSRTDTIDYTPSSNNNNQYSSMPVRLPVFQTSGNGSYSKPYTPQSEAELPSFLSRGEKFSY